MLVISKEESKWNRLRDKTVNSVKQRFQYSLQHCNLELKSGLVKDANFRVVKSFHSVSEDIGMDK